MKKTGKIFIGIDFAKEKFDACYLDGDGAESHAVFQNDSKEYRRLITWVRKTSGVRGALPPGDILFCGEHTGACSLPLSEWLVARGYRVWLDNPVRIKRSAGIVRGKSDKADAAMIARYAMEKYRPGESRLFAPDTGAVRELRSLYSCRMELVKERVGVGNRITSGSFGGSRAAYGALKKIHGELALHERRLEQEMEKLMLSSPEIAGNYRILMSFKGIGTLTAAMFIIYTGNFTRFSSPREFACHIGVAPFGRDSGDSVHVKPHVSDFAHKKAKAAMVQAAKAAMRFNPAIRRYAQRLEARGKHHGVILNNVKNKIIHIVFRMVQSRTEWDPDYQQGHMSGNRSPRPLGDKREGAARTAPSTDLSVQSSPSAFGGVQSYEKTPGTDKSSKKTSPKICFGT